MANYFLFGAIGQCPQCADHRFSGPPRLTPDASVTCHMCGHVCTVEAAVTTALKSGVVKKLSDHRVVQGS
jgi:formate hydrogenlyase subunit 6/NADH:ubiquinone oxidoreductase subunit I